MCYSPSTPELSPRRRRAAEQDAEKTYLKNVFSAFFSASPCLRGECAILRPRPNCHRGDAEPRSKMRRKHTSKTSSPRFSLRLRASAVNVLFSVHARIVTAETPSRGARRGEDIPQKRFLRVFLCVSVPPR